MLSFVSVHAHALLVHVALASPLALQSVSIVHVAKEEKKISISSKGNLNTQWKELLQSVSNLNCAQYYCIVRILKAGSLKDQKKHGL